MKWSILSGMVLMCTALWAQPERKLARAGNELYEQGKFADAEASYKKALNARNNMPEAIFNLGDAQYKQERYDDAAKQFQLMSTIAPEPEVKAASYHNLGNALLEKKEYQKAIDAYKKALRIRPQDQDTKYNLAYANAKLKEQQEQQSKQNQQNDEQQDQKDQKDQNKDQQKGDKEQEQDQKGDQQKEKKEGEGKDGKEPKDQKGQQPQQGKFSKEQAERLLQALGKEEEKTQQKMQLQKGNPQDIKILKDW